MIQWKDEYSIGIPEIDAQHKILFEIADSAYALLNNKLLLDKYDKLAAIFEELRDYTVYHFSCEEKFMASINYKKLLSHKVIHDDFIEKVNEINLDKVDEQQEQYLLDILDFLVKWIEEHILGQDKQITAN